MPDKEPGSDLYCRSSCYCTGRMAPSPPKPEANGTPRLDAWAAPDSILRETKVFRARPKAVLRRRRSDPALGTARQQYR